MNKGPAAAIALVVVLAAGGVARAADPRAESARAHFQQGDTYFKLDKYAAALQEFEQAYLAKQDPSFLYNIAQCHRLMGDRVEAIRFYKRYVNDAPSAPNRPVAEKHIRDLESALGAEELTGTHPAPPPPTPNRVEPVTGTPPPGTTPPPAPTQPTTLALGAAPPPPPPQSDAMLNNSASPSQSDDHPFYTRWWFWTAVGGAIVTAVVLTAVLSRDPSCPSGRQCQ